MEIKFTVDAEQLNKALKVVAIIAPQVTAELERGYLFVVEGDMCRVYSTNGGHQARSSFPITDVEGAGAFMYPADYIAAFEYISDPIAFVATVEGDSYKVNYTYGSSGVAERASFDPHNMNLFEREIQEALTQEPKKYSIKVLQMALGMAKPFAAKLNETVTNEFYKTVQIFGDDGDPELAKKANGYVFSSNGTEAFYLQSDLFKGKGLAVPGQHLPLLEAFMSQSLGALSIYKTDAYTYAANENDDVIGWPRHEHIYEKFSYYTKDDTVIAYVDCKRMYRQLQSMRAGLGSDKNKKKMCLHFNPSTKSFWFTSVDEGNNLRSLPVADVEEKPVVSKVSELAANVNVNHMLQLFEGAKGELMEFRVLLIPAAPPKRPKNLFMFRTIDDFLLGEDGSISGTTANEAGKVYPCSVTRFTPGID